MTTSVSDDISGFFEKNYERIFRYVRGMVRDANEAEDLTQETFLRAYRERMIVLLTATGCVKHAGCCLLMPVFQFGCGWPCKFLMTSASTQ